MFAFWMILSGKFDLFHITAGIISSLAVALFSGKFILSNPTDRGGVGIEIYRFSRYTLWLIYQIFISGIDVTKRVFKVKMPINPGIIKCRPKLESDVALTMLANSITLTPGTMTVDISDGEIFIHCLAIEDEQKLIESEADFEAHIIRLLGYKDQGEKK
jgi:multicomponent Na+:H+ antiporter subunit E